MANIKYEEHWFEIPDEDYTGTQLQERAKMDRDAVPVIRRGSKDIPVEPDEVVNLQHDDRVIFTTPVESAMDLKSIYLKRFNGNLLSYNRGNQTDFSLVFNEEDYVRMRKHLLRDDGKERISFILFGTRGAESIEEAYVYKILNLDDSEYAKQNRMYVVPKVVSQLKAFREYSESDVIGFMHVHSHPFSQNARFSGTDEGSVHGTVRSLRDYLLAGDITGKFLYGTLVIGQEESGFSGSVYDKNAEITGNVRGLKVVGMKGIRRINGHQHKVSENISIPDKELLDRNIKWLGEDGQRRLSDTSLVICGAGGVGGMVALNARGLGFRKITLIDDDRIEKSNLNRLPAATLNDVGEYKVNVIKRMIREVSPATEVDAIPERVSCEQGRTRKIITEADIIVAAVDSFEARFDIQWLAARYLKPLIDIGSGINLRNDTATVKFMGGQIACYIPGNPCLCCQAVVPRDIESSLSREVRRMTGYVKGTDVTPTSVVTINSIVAGYAVDMVIKYITGFSEIKTYLKCDLLQMSNQTFNFSKKPNCLLCGENSVEGKGDDVNRISLNTQDINTKQDGYTELIHELLG